MWIATADAHPRLLTTFPPFHLSTFPPFHLSTFPPTPNGCPTLTAGLPTASPDGTHLLASEGQPCGGLVLDPGPLFVVDTATGKLSAVLLPNDATALPQVRSYGWVDNRTVFAFSPKYNLRES